MKTLFVLGPATQDCLTQTIVDACTLSLQVVILEDAIESTDHSADSLREKIQKAGALHAYRIRFGFKHVAPHLPKALSSSRKILYPLHPKPKFTSGFKLV